MTNPDNLAVVHGNLTRDPYVTKNEDGSEKIFITVATTDSYKSQDGKINAQYIPLEKFIPAYQVDDSKKTVFDYMAKGSEVTVTYTVKNNNYTDKDGKPVYGYTFAIDSVKLGRSPKNNTSEEEHDYMDITEDNEFDY